MSTLLRIIFFVGDLLFLNASVVLSYAITNQLSGAERVNMIYLLIFSNLTWFFLIIVSNPYSFSRNWGFIRFLRTQVSYVVVHLFVIAFLIFFFKKSYSPLQVGTMYFTFIPVFFGWKLLVTYLVTSFSEKRIVTRNMIIVGGGEMARDIRKYYLLHPELNLRFLTKFDFGNELKLDEVKAFCAENEVHEIFCCLPDINDAELRKLIDFGLNQFIRVRLISSFTGAVGGDFSLNTDERLLIVNRPVVPLDILGNRVMKRIFDVVFSGLVFVFILSWLFPLIGLLIKLDSKGPVFFRQKRAGLNNKPFDCLKFRTMVVNDQADQQQATKDDPRITSIGKFLRKSSLDEFPQFINVLLGDMSFIGPRPHPIKLNEAYLEKIEGLMSRHYVKPGITGLAQSMGYRGETKNVLDMKNRIAMDRFYIENWSILLDMKITLRTAISLIKGSENAY
jgi:Undecaprenyl-phosphate glucose phosphotransferase